ncbi:diguanylate cyclase [Kosakonia sp. SMBL-WEM22]|uniref:diguanylate cyclase n=1 Tax=Kosakonia sp. SMBL-WEM22 TaxID=2725560 RepID=UPI001659134A|nr:diguanylate cyclase [Kosakonia sp. SMBL-WEM22]QNQ20899.1 diguanylate cyclase [Kosakonia sp. SMBL-WEM22]
MTYYSPDEKHLKLRSQRFVRRMFMMRQLGTVLCYVPILSVLKEAGYGIPSILLLSANAFVWPWIACLRATRSADPASAEKKNLTADAFLGGIWVALMQMSPFPSCIIMAVLASDRYAAGGLTQLKSAVKAFLCAFLPLWLIKGGGVNLELTPRTVWLTLPLATFYILALSIASYNLTLKLRKRNHELERIALMDPELEIPNRRMFDRRLESEYLSTLRGDSSGYLLLMDLDYFKSVNDTWGHEAGDFLLTQISRVLRNHIGYKDTPARFGGDELGVIVHNASDLSVMILARRLQKKIGEIRLPASSEFRCTMSIGIASAAEAGSIYDWLRHADTALYKVKRSGRDGVCLWQPPLSAED